MRKNNLSFPSVLAITALIILLWIFSEKLWVQASLWRWVVAEDMSHYQGDSQSIERYNEAIFESNKWQYDAAWSLITPLLSDKNFEKRPELYELAGDILYKQWKISETILYYYQFSLTLQSPNLRVEKKIGLLQEPRPQAMSWSTDASSGTTSSGSSPADEVFLKKKEFQETSGKRNQYLDMHASEETPEERIIRESMQVLEGGKIQKEW
jgi:hypothetical protein